MARNKKIAAWLIELTVLLALAPLSGCTLVGLGVGSAIDSAQPSRAEVVAEQRYTEDPISLTAPPQDESHGMSAAAAGATVGAVVDVIAVVVAAGYVVLLSQADFGMTIEFDDTSGW